LKLLSEKNPINLTYIKTWEEFCKYKIHMYEHKKKLPKIAIFSNSLIKDIMKCGLDNICMGRYIIGGDYGGRLLKYYLIIPKLIFVFKIEDIIIYKKNYENFEFLFG